MEDIDFESSDSLVARMFAFYVASPGFDSFREPASLNPSNDVQVNLLKITCFQGEGKHRTMKPASRR